MSYLHDFVFDLSGEVTIGAFGGLGVRVEFSELLPTRTFIEREPCVFMFHSEPVLAQLLAGVLWHDERINCPTWTDAAECVCDRRGQ